MIIESDDGHFEKLLAEYVDVIEEKDNIIQQVEIDRVKSVLY